MGEGTAGGVKSGEGCGRGGSGGEADHDHDLQRNSEAVGNRAEEAFRTHCAGHSSGFGKARVRGLRAVIQDVEVGGEGQEQKSFKGGESSHQGEGNGRRGQEDGAGYRRKSAKDRL